MLTLTKKFTFTWYSASYELYVTITGVKDIQSGLIINSIEFKSIVTAKLKQPVIANPTLENLTEYIVDKLKQAFPLGITLLEVRLGKTATNYCAWIKDINVRTGGHLIGDRLIGD